MGTSHGLADFEAKVALLSGAAFADVAYRAHRRIGARAKYDVVPQAVKPDTGGDAILSNYGSTKRRRGKVRLSARYDVNEKRVRIAPSPPAPWALLEEGSHAQEWTIPKASRRRGPIVVQGRVVDHAVHHGLRPKHTWSAVRPRVAELAPRIVNAEVVRMLGKVF